MFSQLLEISRRKPIEQTTEAEADPAISAQRFLLASVPIFSPSRDGKLKFNPKIQRKIFGTFLGKLKIVENEYEARLGLAIVKGMPELLAESVVLVDPPWRCWLREILTGFGLASSRNWSLKRLRNGLAPSLSLQM